MITVITYEGDFVDVNVRRLEARSARRNGDYVRDNRVLIGKKE